jgi:hypothetical protein
MVDNAKKPSRGCGACSYFHPSVSGHVVAPERSEWNKITRRYEPSTATVGECRIDGPRFSRYDYSNDGFGAWPAVWSDDWCGRFRTPPTEVDKPPVGRAA